MATTNDASPEKPIELPAAQQPAPSHCHSYKKLILAVLLTLIAISLMISLYVCWQAKQLQITQKEQESRFTQLIDTLKAEQTSSNEFSNQYKESQAQLAEQIKEMDQNLKTAQRQYSYHNQDWVLLKARYYLQLAQINDHWSENTTTTIALMQQADALLKEMGDQSSFFPIRQAIAKEITELKAQPSKDIAGILSQIDAAQNLIPKLPIKQIASFSAGQPTNSSVNTATPDSWRGRLKESLRVFEKLVVVRRNDEDVTPMISPLHETLVRDYLKMNLQTAQWAVIQNNPLAYKNALIFAGNEIERSFDQKAVSSQAFLNQLAELKLFNFSKPDPVINESLTLLNQLIDSRNAETKPPQTTGGESQ